MVKQNSIKKKRSECPISCALDLVGDAWTLLVVRDVLFHQRRKFSDIAAAEGIASNILTDRLARLEQAGLVTRNPDPTDRRKKVIVPTAKAWALTPVLLELALFGQEECSSEEGEVPLRDLVAGFRLSPEESIKRLKEKGWAGS